MGVQTLLWRSITAQPVYKSIYSTPIMFQQRGERAVQVKFLQHMWNLRAKVKHKSAVTASAGCRYLGGDSVSYSLKKNPSWEAKSQDINRYLQNPKVHYSIHKSLPPFPILSSSSRACKHLNFSLWGVVNTSPNPQTGGPPLASRPLLLIQYIRSYPPNLEAIPLSAI